MGCIYGIRNTKTDQWYIGQTVHETPRIRLSAHFHGKQHSLIRQAVEEHGILSFEIRILASNISVEDLDVYEQAHIGAYKSMHPNGYNRSMKPQGKRSKHKRPFAMIAAA